jgi:hypothetical protein
MKVNGLFLFSLIIATCLSSLSYGKDNASHGLVQADTILAPNVLAAVPVIDGRGDDACWQNVPWQPIMQEWIPYGGTVDSAIYWGHYKVIWSSTTNLLYFLMEVYDIVIVDGFIAGVTADIYNYDISEVFIDENASGGLHMYDSPPQNAENAFAYHMYAACPAEGEATTSVHADDMAGSDGHRANYSSHFPGFALRKTGNIYTREFSLIVYNDTYTEANKDAARSQLAEEKLMGLSVAYCDNNDPDESPIVRDYMFGSVWEPSPGNLHWQNANYFGHIKLAPEQSTGVAVRQPVAARVLKLYPNPASSTSQIEAENTYRGEVAIRIYNILGQEIFRTSASKLSQQFAYTLKLQNLPPSLYFIKMSMGNNIYSEKLLVVKNR